MKGYEGHSGKKGAKRWLAGLLAAVMASAGGLSVWAEQAPAVIIDTEAGETQEQATSEEVPAWAAAEADAPAEASALEIGGKSAILIELSSGQVLFEKNPHEKLPIASVTKVMTLLLIMEAIDQGTLAYDEPVTCSAHAASLGGSQIWLEEGEVMTVHDLLKAIAVVSANDACAMMAERISGSEEGFVARMNERAAELGMADTLFTDCCGLDEAAYSSAYDVALMSRELMKHPKITEYTTIWMDTLRNGESQLVNTNKLVRHYSGATGLKTGTTSQAGHCLSATAERDGMGLCAVILGCSTTDERFGGARKMLDYGFANYAVYTPAVDEAALTPVKVLRGAEETVAPEMDPLTPLLIKKGQEAAITPSFELAADLEAPVYERQVIGKLTLTLDGSTLAEYEVYASQAVARLGIKQAFARLLAALIA